MSMQSKKELCCLVAFPGFDVRFSILRGEDTTYETYKHRVLAGCWFLPSRVFVLLPTVVAAAKYRYRARPFCSKPYLDRLLLAFFIVLLPAILRFLASRVTASSTLCAPWALSR